MLIWVSCVGKFFFSKSVLYLWLPLESIGYIFNFKFFWISTRPSQHWPKTVNISTSGARNCMLWASVTICSFFSQLLSNPFLPVGVSLCYLLLRKGTPHLEDSEWGSEAPLLPLNALYSVFTDELANPAVTQKLQFILPLVSSKWRILVKYFFLKNALIIKQVYQYNIQLVFIVNYHLIVDFIYGNATNRSLV